MLGRESAKVSIDKEGDVALEVKNVYIYITRFGASCSIVRVPLGTLSAATLTQSMPNIIAEVHQLRSKFLKPLEYALRIYCSVWSQDASGVKRMHSEYFSPLRKVVPSEGNLLELTSLSCSYGYVFGQFKDKIDIESGHPEVTFRIVRQADASQFPDFAKFWDKVDIQDMVGKIEPFLDALEAKQSGISGLLGGTTKR